MFIAINYSYSLFTCLPVFTHTQLDFKFKFFLQVSMIFNNTSYTPGLSTVYQSICPIYFNNFCYFTANIYDH